MRKSVKGLLVGCAVGLMPLNIRAASEETGISSSEQIEEFLEETKEETQENNVYTKIGTIASTDLSVTIVWPLEERADYGYRIFVKKSDRYVKVGETGPGENRFLLEKIKGKPLDSGTTYTVKVVALKQNGSRKKVVSYRLIRTATMPETPELVSAKRKSGKKAVVGWECLTDVSGYELQLGTDPQGEFETIGYFGRNKSKAAIRKLKKKKNYYIRIRAYKTVTGGRVYGEWSELKKL